MKILFKISLVALLSTLLSISLYSNTRFAVALDTIGVDAMAADSMAVDTIDSAKNLISGVASETREMSNYFSLSKILITLIILVLTFFFVRIIAALLSAWGERTTKHRITIKGFIPVVRILAWMGSFSFIVVAVFRPPMASVLAFTATIGVAIGFAAQDLVKNIFGGIIIITDKPFQLGDKIEIGNHYGEVSSIGLRSTRIITPDDNTVSVPNSEVMSQAVSNANAGEENCQVVTEIFLPLNADMNRIRNSAMEAAQVSPYIFLNKPISVLFFQEKIGHKVMLKVKVKAYVNDLRNEFALKSNITETLTNEFQEYYREDPLEDPPELK